MVEDILKDAERRMLNTLRILQQEFVKMRTGRANPGLLEQILVNCYGTDLPLSQVAGIGVQDPRTLSVTAFDKAVVPAIEKAIMNSDLGISPVTAGDVIRVPLPPLTEERRKELIKLIRSVAEKARIALRNVRRDANQAVKEESMAKDETRSAEDKVQKLTDKHIREIDNLLAEKEEEMMVI